MKLFLIFLFIFKSFACIAATREIVKSNPKITSENMVLSKEITIKSKDVTDEILNKIIKTENGKTNRKDDLLSIYEKYKEKNIFKKEIRDELIKSFSADEKKMYKVFKKYSILENYKKLNSIYDINTAISRMNYFIKKGFLVYESKLNLLLLETKDSLTNEVISKIEALSKDYPKKSHAYEFLYLLNRNRFIKKNRDTLIDYIDMAIELKSNNRNILKKFLVDFRNVINKERVNRVLKISNYVINNNKILHFNQKELSEIQRIQTILYIRKNDYINALKTVKNIKDKMYMDRIMFAKCLLYFNKKDEALRYLEREADDFYEWQVHYFIGKIYFEDKKYDKALKHFIETESKKYWTIKKERNIFIKHLYYIGKIYYIKGETKKSEKFYKRFKRIYKAYNKFFLNDKEIEKMVDDAKISIFDF